MKYKTTSELLKQDTLTYQDILNLKKRLSGYARASEEHKQETEKAYSEDMQEEYNITPEHTAKGLEYLYRVSFKPSVFASLAEAQEAYKKDQDSIEKGTQSNCPLGYRELDILLKFDHFTFAGFYDATTSYQYSSGFRNLYPLWRCYSVEGDSFEYYMAGGEMQIVG